MPRQHNNTAVRRLGGVKAVRARLEERRQEIVALYEQDLRAGMQASSEASDDLVDRANNAYERELMFALSNGERSTLILIDEALQRLDEGKYGVCGNCSCHIGIPRLRAVPSARYCIECQELAEQNLLDD